VQCSSSFDLTVSPTTLYLGNIRFAYWINHFALLKFASEAITDLA
jgi:hypothetical protein